MISSLILISLVSAAPAPVGQRLLYEQRCLYCHSSELSERKLLMPAQWKAMVESMRIKAPLLITRTDARTITAYIVETLKLVPKGVAPVVPVARAPRPRPAPVAAVVSPTAPIAAAEVKPAEPIAPEPLNVIELEPLPTAVAEVEEAPMRPEDELAEQEGAALMQRRCSKCHTLNRVFNKLDTFERSMATVRRMRLKTGSGITSSDLETIEKFLRLDLEKPDKNSADGS